MEFSKNTNDSESLWSAFDQLEEIENVAESLEDLSIPDATYRQIKELNLALIANAKRLAETEKEIRRQKELLELDKRNFEAERLQSTRESTESRLGRLVKIDQAIRGGTPIPEPDPVIPETSHPVPNVESPHIEPELDIRPSTVLHDAHVWEQEFDIEGQEIIFRHDPEISTGSESPQAPDDDLDRFQTSAQNLREKSEIISAIFVELDQMVRDLSRQQELLEELKMSHNQDSVTELDRVNDKLKRRFRRLSRQINYQKK